MKYIPLTRGCEAIVDDWWYEELVKYKWFCSAKGYAARSGKIKGNPREAYMHKVIMSAPEGYEVDHKDGNRNDCREQNLRACTHAENCRNKRRPVHNTTGFKNVKPHKTNGKFQARITTVGGVRKSLGYYDTPEEAYSVYLANIQKYHGDFARAS